MSVFLNWLRPGINSELLKKWLGLLFGAVIFTSACIYQGYFKQINHVFFDAVMSFKHIPVDKRIVIIGLDERSIKDLGSWPLPRQFFSNFLSQLATSGNQPAGIGFDLVFSNPDPLDELFTAQLLATGGHVAVNMQLPSKLKDGSSSRMYKDVATTNGQRIPQQVAISDPRIVSHVNFALGGDGIFRGVRMYDSKVPHLSLSVSGLENKYRQLPEQLSRFPIIKNLSDFKHISFVDTFEPNRTDFSIFKDAYVLIGTTAESLGDRYPSSYMGKMMIDTPRVLFTASVLNALLQDRLIEVASVRSQILITAFILLLSLLIFVTVSPAREIAATTALFFSAAIGSWVALLYLDRWIDPTPVLLALPIVKAIWSWMQLKATLQFIEQKAGQLNLASVSESDPQLPIVKTLALLDRAILETNNRFNNLKLLVDALPDPVFAINNADEIVFFNQAFEALFVGPQGDHPSSLSDLVSKYHFPVESLEGLSPTATAVKPLLIHTQHGVKHFIPRQVVIFWSGTERLRVIACPDVTSVMALQAQRDKTLQLLSHDTRSPLSGIMLLCKKGDTSSLTDLADIEKFAQRALAMMDSFILAIKAESDKYNCAIHVFDSLLEQAVYEVRERVRRYGVELQLRQDQLLYVNCDSRLIERVLVNVLNNAIRFSPNLGIIDIHVYSQLRDNHPFLICAVTNTMLEPGSDRTVDVQHKSYQLGHEFIDRVIHRHCGFVTKNFDTAAKKAVVEVALPCLPD